MLPRVEVPAYAKINLGLRVLGKRPDGFHDIETYLLQIDLADRLSFEALPHAEIRFTCSWPELADAETNLCVRACRLLEKACDRQLGLAIHLQKAIPHAAGLGGGSSDAAVTLMAANELGRLGLTVDELHRLAAQLGSDVPFFLHGGLAYACGRGEIVTPLDYLPDVWVLVVKPEFAISTKEVYEGLKFGLTNSKKNTTLANLKNSLSEFGKLREVCHNELELVVFALHPELAEIKSRLRGVGAVSASLAGSGSALFGIFTSQRAVVEGERVFGKSYRTFATRPVHSGIQQVQAIFAALPPEEMSRVGYHCP